MTTSSLQGGGFPDSSAGTESIHLQCRRPQFDSWVGKTCWKGIGYPLQHSWASLVAQLAKNPFTIAETWIQSLGWEDPLEKVTATHSSIVAWRIPWTVESIGLQRVRYDWATFTFTACKGGLKQQFPILLAPGTSFMEDNLPWVFVGGCKWWGAAVNTDEAPLTHQLLTSCCEAQFLTGHRPVLVHGPGVRDPWAKGSRAFQPLWTLELTNQVLF